MADDPFDQAAATAARCDRLAWVFASGYVGALQSLFGVAPSGRAALCVTEDGGNSPRAITTRLVDGQLHGTKSFVTFGSEADTLLVLAVRGEADGRKDLVLARTSAEQASVAGVLTTPFMPEVSHARMEFDGASAEVVFDDAWPMVKAFRYVEDVFVLGTTLAWLTATSARAGALEQASGLAALVLSARGLAAADPASPASHLAYEGLHTLAHAAIETFDWSAVPEDIAAMWQRDRAVLQIAAKARRARADLARKALGI